MRAAINHLQSLGVEPVVVAGFSLGSRLAAAHVVRGQIDELPVVGFIRVGMYGTSGGVISAYPLFAMILPLLVRLREQRKKPGQYLSTASVW